MFRANVLSLFALVLVLGLAAQARAVVVVSPTGLNPGDQYRLAFITSTTRDATSTNIADYNAHVTSAANSVAELNALGTTWTALGSTQTVNARDNTATDWTPAGIQGVRIFLLNNTLLASDYDNLWNVPDNTTNHAKKFNITENGTIFAGAATTVWTGTHLQPGNNAGNAYPDGYLGYSPNVVTGNTAALNGAWANQVFANRTSARSLFAISDVLTVPSATVAMPEPASIALLSGGLFALVGYRGRERSRSAAKMA